MAGPRFSPGPCIEPELLARIVRPSRYLGGELGQVRKDLSGVRVAVGLCYPDLYEIGMSHMGLKVLYSLLNEQRDVAAERVYAVAPDMEEQLRSRRQPLRTLENRIPLHDLDVLGFTLQYELSYSNLLQVLDLGGVPLRSCDRTADHPLVLAGGPCAFNPEPLAPFLDAVCLGDGEEATLAVVRTVQAWREGGGRHRQELLRSLAELPGIYVPSLYRVGYHDDGRVAAVEPLDGAPARVRKAIVSDLDAAPHPTSTPVPFMKIVHDRVGIEIQRGCMRGCRFCQAGYVYRPERQRSPETVARLAREGLAATGWEQYSLLSLSAGDYACMEPLLASLMDEHEARRAAIGLPSMRLETLTPGIAEQISRVRKTSFTVAPEAATDRLRAVINKVIDEDVLIDMVGEVFARGWRSLKLYFMVGLPTEQENDVRAIPWLASRCLREARRHDRGAGITVSASTFVPKAHTPFQWAPQADLEAIRDKQSVLRNELKRSKLGFRWHEARSTVMEGVFSRGDRRIAGVLEQAYQDGARLDGWREHFDQDRWLAAFDQRGLDPAFYTQRTRDRDEVFAWDHLDSGVDRDWLLQDWDDALESGFVPDCTTAPCYDCGVCDHEVVHHRLYRTGDPGEEPRHRFRKGPVASLEQRDPQLASMPRPPGRKATGAPDSVPPRGMSPGSAAARARRVDLPPAPAPAGPAGPLPDQGDERPSAPEPDGADRWEGVFDTGLPRALRMRVEIRYGKRGPLVHLGHLEVMGAFRRALRRTGAPVLWSKGFHPQMKLTFGLPLPSGMASEAEWADLELKRPVEVGSLTALLKAAMPDDLPILEVNEVPSKRKAVAARIVGFDYRVGPPVGALPAAIEAVERYRASETWPVQVERKEAVQAVDLKEAGVTLEAVEADGFRLGLRSDGAGARVRDALRGIFGDDAASGTAGWTVLRERTRFRQDAPRPAPAAGQPRPRRSS